MIAEGDKDKEDKEDEEESKLNMKHFRDIATQIESSVTNKEMKILLLTKNARKKLEFLQRKLNTERQGTRRWHEKRTSMFTASSDVACLLSTRKKTHESLYIKKQFGSGFKGNMYTAHGNKFEPVAKGIYECQNKVQIHDAPLIKHDELPLGASPDGVVVDTKKGTLKLIEIKCPFSRIPNGNVSKRYYIQMQTQLQCTDISECIFLECVIKEYRSKKKYDEDEHKSDDKLRANSLQKGMIGRIGFESLCPNNKYIYPDFELTSKEQYDWLKKEQLKYSDKKIVMYIDYWKLCKLSQVTVKRDDIWWNTNKISEKIKQHWDYFTSVWKKCPQNHIPPSLPIKDEIPEKNQSVKDLE